LPLVLAAPAGQANLPLGVFRSVRYDEGEDRAQAGERLVLYTDEEFGEKGVPRFAEGPGGRRTGDRNRDSLVDTVTAP